MKGLDKPTWLFGRGSALVKWHNFRAHCLLNSLQMRFLCGLRALGCNRYMAVWAERIGQQIKATKSAAERDAVLVREDNVKINFSMYVAGLRAPGTRQFRVYNVSLLCSQEGSLLRCSRYSDHKATFKLSVGEVYRMCGPVWKTIQNLVVQVCIWRPCTGRVMEPTAHGPAYRRILPV